MEDSKFMRTIRGESWRDDLAANSIIYLHDCHEINCLALSDKIQVCSRCSKTKGGTQQGKPKDFYVGCINLKFYSWCEARNISYAILSDKYGLYLQDEVKDWYDVHPSSLQDEDFKKLGKLIRDKMKSIKKWGFLFYNTSPVMSNPYFKMMMYAGGPIYFITSLPDIPTRTMKGLGLLDK
uniref:Uncharacterized protein n=1 Tax=viral metagenome TaxID=1070528 RepID=A0A6M3IJ24_9ZZZZ